MNTKITKSIATIAITGMLALTSSNVLAWQTAPGYDALRSKTVSEFFIGIRKMEEEGGPFGKSATINETTGLEASSNGLDVHMIKNTEWGAVAMLASCKYGAGEGIVVSATKTGYIYPDIASTTHNKTGVYGMYNGLATYEYVAGGIKEKCMSSYNKMLSTANSRYVDSYISDSSEMTGNKYITGDATIETKGMSQGGGDFVYSSSPVFKRGYYGVLSSRNSSGDSYSIYGSRCAVWSASEL